MKRLLCLFMLILLMVSPAWAAISCGDAIEFNDATPTDPETISYTTPAGTNQVLFVGVSIRDSLDAIGGVTHAGNAMTAVAAEVFETPIRTRMFYIVNPTSGTNDVVVDLTGTVALADAIVIFTCSGVNTGAPVHDATSASGTGTAVTLTVPNLVAGDVVIDMVGADIETVDPSEGANQTVLHKGNDGVEMGWGASFQSAADGGVMSWTLQGGAWAQQAVALTPAVSTGGQKSRNQVVF